MKRLLTFICTYFLADHKWARRKVGGKWYRAIENQPSGFASPVKYWTRYKPDEASIIEEESYDYIDLNSDNTGSKAGQ